MYSGKNDGRIRLFTSESVSEGHPDKVCDQISDAILDACLAEDPDRRVAVETLVTNDYVCIAGEVTTNANVDYEAVARSVIEDIGYIRHGIGFDSDTVQIDVRICRQSADICLGVSAETSSNGEQGAGDQGMMFGYACEGTNGIPPSLYYSHQIMHFAESGRKSGLFPCLLPDAKSQVTMRFQDGQVPRLDTVVFSHQHKENASQSDIRDIAMQCVLKSFPAVVLEEFDWNHLLVNPTGRFEIGGPAGDTGLTGRKIIVDSYGGAGHHGGGAFSGKDPSKVDRSGAYFARYVAKNLVAAGACSECEIQVAYAIGVSLPVSLHFNFFGTANYDASAIEDCVFTLFDFRPRAIEELFSLRKPSGWSYRQTASGGHFGRDIFPWEKMDAVAAIQEFLADFNKK